MRPPLTACATPLTPHSYADGWCVLSDMATIVGNATIAKECATMCARVTDAIVANMWNQDLNRFVTL